MIKVTMTLYNGTSETFFVKSYDRCGVGPPGFHFFFTEDGCKSYDQRQIKGIDYEEQEGLFQQDKTKEISHLEE